MGTGLRVGTATGTRPSTPDSTDEAIRQPWARAIRRAGWVAKGVVYSLVAYLCIRIVFGGPDPAAQDASAAGAIHLLALQPGGTALLLVLAFGMFAYAADRLLAGTVVATPGASKLERMRPLGNALAWTGLGVLAVKTAIGPDDGGSSDPAGVTATLMQWSLGPWLVGAVGVGMLVFAATEVLRAVRRDGTEERRSRLSRPARRWVAVIEALGIGGHGVAFGLLGYFLLQAAVTHDPQQAESLDGALQRFAGEPFGSVVVIATALGLLLYAVHCFIHARMRQVAGDT